MGKKHFIVTFENNIAQTTETLTWARKYYPNFNDETTNNDVYNYLVDQKEFNLISDQEKFICFNFNKFKLTNNTRYVVIAKNKQDGKNYYAKFTIGNDNYVLERRGSVYLYKNEEEIVNVINGLRDIIEILSLDENDFIYNENGNKRVTNDLAYTLFKFL